MRAPAIEPPRDFLVEEMVVYPTLAPERARQVEVPPQTIKMAAIRRGQAAEAQRREGPR